MQQQLITVNIQIMRTSAGADYYVAINCGGRTTTPFMFKKRFKAEYEADHLKWVFGLREEEPWILDYNEDSYPDN